jgi:hypothetical protein
VRSARLTLPRYEGKSPATPRATPTPSSPAAMTAPARIPAAAAEPAPSGAAYWPGEAGFPAAWLPSGLTGGLFRPTGTIVPGASMLANRVHAADQPSGVSAQRWSGSSRGAPTAHTP